MVNVKASDDLGFRCLMCRVVYFVVMEDVEIVILDSWKSVPTKDRLLRPKR